MSSAPDTQFATVLTNKSSKIITDSTDVRQESSKNRFDLKNVRDAFVNCIQPNNVLLLGEYVRAYEELCTFVCSLGAVFEWATKDLSNKLIVLKEHQRFDPMNYETIQSMILYEIESGRIQSRDTTLFSQTGKPLQNVKCEMHQMMLVQQLSLAMHTLQLLHNIIHGQSDIQ
ncbi:unnamed protein product [Rotaria magnacalcarata]